MKKNNVLVILCDQLRKGFLSCYGFKAHQTKYIDSLAEDGILFTNAITSSPVCAPARAGMMTGRYVTDHGVWTNDVPFRKGMDYLPQRMKACGYLTGAFGKLHHFPPKDTKGFEYCFQMEENRMGEQDDYYRWLKERHSKITNVFPHNEKGEFAFKEEEYYEHWIADHTIQFIEESRKMDRPFFAWTSFQGPHTPIDPPQDVKYILDKQKMPPIFHMKQDSNCDVPNYRKYANYAQFTEEENKSYRIGYCQLIQEIDHQVGRILCYLKQNNLYENTTIIFAADHGDMCGDLGHRQKGPMPYSAQLEIPFIWTNSPKVGKGESDILLSNLDIGATILAVAGDKEPFGVSRNIEEMLKNKEKRHTTLYAEFCDSVKIVEDRQYRLAYYPFTGQSELFDKTRKESELFNLANEPQYTAIQSKLLQEIIDYMIIAKGVHIEAQDLVPAVQQGLQDKLPNFKDSIPLVFPLRNEASRNYLKEAGLDPDYNEFCKSRELMRHYGAYWLEEGEEKHGD